MPNGIWCRFALQEGLLDRLKHSSMKNRTFVDMRAVADAVVTMHQKMELPLFIPEVDSLLTKLAPVERASGGVSILYTAVYVLLVCACTVAMQRLLEVQTDRRCGNRILRALYHSINPFRACPCIQQASDLLVHCLAVWIIIFFCTYQDLSEEWA